MALNSHPLGIAFKRALLTGGLFFILLGVWFKLREIYNTNKAPEAYAVMDFLEKNHFLDMPGLQLKDLNEKSVDLSRFNKNQVYIINFWATWCEPCAQEFPSMVKLLEAYGADLHIIAISNDSSREDIDTFAKAFKLDTQPNLTMIWDKDMSVAKLFQVGKLPESFIFNKQGKLDKKIVGTRDWSTPDAIQYFKLLTQ